MSVFRLVLILCLVVRLYAADDVTPLQFDRLDLTDGRKLKKVMVKAYDASSGKLLLVASGKAMTIPIALVPAPFQEALKSNAPNSGGSTSAVPATAIPPTGPSNKGGASAPSQPAPEKPMPVAPVTPEPDFAQIKTTALTRAQNYYRYEYPAGSGSIRVTAISFETDDPEVIVGWAGRYRVQGRTLLEYFDSRGYSYNRTTDRFEVTLEQKPGKSLQVVDFTRK